MPEARLKSYEPVPAGTYRLRITDCQERKGQDGNKYLAWTLEICNEDSENYEKTFVYSTGSEFGPKTKAAAFLHAAGLPETEAGQDLIINTDDYLAQEFYAEVIIKKAEKSDQMKNDLKVLWTLDGFAQHAKQAAKLAAAPAPAKSGTGKATAAPAPAPSGKPTGTGKSAAPAAKPTPAAKPGANRAASSDDDTSKATPSEGSKLDFPDN